MNTTPTPEPSKPNFNIGNKEVPGITETPKLKRARKQFEKKLKASINAIVDQREEILKAFLAKYGLDPANVRQVVARSPDGQLSWRVEAVNKNSKSRIIIP